MAKSGKILPVVIISSLRGKKHNAQDYAEFLVLTFALVVFGTETEGQGSDMVGTTTMGVLLLAGCVLFDSLTPNLQDRAFAANPGVDALQMTFGMAAVASAACVAVLVGGGTFPAVVHFFWNHPEASLHLCVLSFSSTVTQFMISYTIRNFGPVVFTLIATTRQAIAVCVSAIFFQHHITRLAEVAATLVFATVLVRAMRRLAPGLADSTGSTGRPDGDPRSRASSEQAGEATGRTEQQRHQGVLVADRARGPHCLLGWSNAWRLAICALGIHAVFGVYAMLQEFLTAHYFDGEIFSFPLFLIAANRTAGAVLSLAILAIQRSPIITRDMRLVAYPAATDLLATISQYQALYLVLFPVQSLLKSLKVIPVMLCGRLFRNRSYGAVDYIEGALITVLVGLFVWAFGIRPAGPSHHPASEPGMVALTFVLIAVYVLADSLTSNVEDWVFQKTQIDPGQQMLGMELFSGIAAWVILSVNGGAGQAFAFLHAHQEAWKYVGFLALASAFGTYTCIVTVRIFGPAVLALLMVSRQIMSIVLSMFVFKHHVDLVAALTLAAVSLLILSASIRRATADGAAPRRDAGEAGVAAVNLAGAKAL